MKSDGNCTATVRSCLFILCIVSALNGQFVRADSQPKRPNILFILTDDQRWDTMGCYGNDVIKTPNFDNLASQGARLDAFIVASPLCCPSRATFLSGLYPHQTGIYTNLNGPDFGKGIRTVADYLNMAGYRTGFVGKAHLGGDPRRWNFKICPIWKETATRGYTDQLLVIDGKSRIVAGPVTTIFANAAIDFIRKYRNERWFLWLATTAPHPIHIQDPKHPYTKTDIQPPPGWPSQEPLKQSDWPDYYSTISMLDEQIGRVINELNKQGIAENTLVLLASDNGDMHGSHKLTGKIVWFEESVRVPALVRWPGKIKPGTQVPFPISSVDLLPSLIEVAGLSKLEKLEGVSMLPALLAQERTRTEVFSEMQDWQMIRTDRWKYVNLIKKKREHLYDLQADPFEQQDLTESKSSVAVLFDMRKKMNRWLTATPELSPHRYYRKARNFHRVLTLTATIITIVLFFLLVRKLRSRSLRRLG